MTLVMPSLDDAAQKISIFEGFSSKPYLDSVGVWTMGYGSTHYPDGRAVSRTDAEVSPSEALAFLEHDLNDAAIHLWKFIKVQPTLNQWSALLSLAYNIGWPAISKSTLIRLFNEGLIERAANQILLWDKGHINGRLVQIKGLSNRRAEERALFLTP